jgi:hypothetical protein
MRARSARRMHARRAPLDKVAGRSQVMRVWEGDGSSESMAFRVDGRIGGAKGRSLPDHLILPRIYRPLQLHLANRNGQSCIADVGLLATTCPVTF